MGETDGFVQMIDAANQFFNELRANNTKEWFEPNRGHVRATGAAIDRLMPLWRLFAQWF